MALEDTVIVTEEQISKLYRRSTEHGHDSSSFYKVLTDNRLLPLTVEMLTTPAGMAILRLATWTYFTGNITIGKKNAFNVWIHGKQALLDNLIEKEISHPIVNFKYSKKKKEFGTIRLSKDSGSIARLVHAMGVPTYDSPFVASDMGQEATSLTKPHYIGEDLPTYFWKVLESSGNESARQELLMEIIGIMSRDRYKSKGPNYKYIQLNTHISKKAATNYGAAVVNFINRVFGENLFSYDQISPTLRSGDGLYNCRINVRDNQVRYLAGKGILPI